LTFLTCDISASALLHQIKFELMYPGHETSCEEQQRGICLLEEIMDNREPKTPVFERSPFEFYKSSWVGMWIKEGRKKKLLFTLSE